MFLWQPHFRRPWPVQKQPLLLFWHHHSQTCLSNLYNLTQQIRECQLCHWWFLEEHLYYFCWNHDSHWQLQQCPKKLCALFWFVLHVLVCNGMYSRVICASIQMYWLVLASMACMKKWYVLYILVCICMYWYQLIYIDLYLMHWYGLVCMVCTSLNL